MKAIDLNSYATAILDTANIRTDTQEPWEYLLGWADAETIHNDAIKCTSGNKPCGARCISTEKKCGIGQALLGAVSGIREGFADKRIKRVEAKQSRAQRIKEARGRLVQSLTEKAHAREKETGEVDWEKESAIDRAKKTEEKASKISNKLGDKKQKLHQKRQKRNPNRIYE